MHKKVNPDLNFAGRELEILKFWQDEKIFEKSIENREGSEAFTFFEGPPTANGLPHIGHVITRAVKDIIPRYQTMKGKKVLRKAGWDTHGLPVELEIEKALKISGKKQIEEYGVEPFIQQCKESVWKYKDIWEKMSARVGFWLDMDKPYVTYDNEYIESVWWALKTIWDKGLLYKGHKVLPYCSRCGTSLSSHEVAQGYKDIKEKSVIAQFKVIDREDEYILAWTTTPWTLPSNVALCVNADEDYVRASQGGKVYILAKSLAENVLGEDFEIIETMKGSALERLAYQPLFDFVKFDVPAHYIVCDPYVLLTEGTGVVHQAPAFGDDDNRVARKYGLPFVQLVNEQGEMTEETPWAGIFAKKADPKILKYMADRDLIYKTLDTQHNYPHCWRCDTPLLYYARSAWFIEMSKVRDKLMENNETVNWMPNNVKHGRFGNFLENVIDWSLSRERYWGTPLPVWVCDCGHQTAVGSVKELTELSGQDISKMELHKPQMDKVTIPCEKCGQTMHRAPEVIDAWFDSGSMPFAQHHYPFAGEGVFNENFPADFISEAVDQTRGWFYTLMAISTLLFDKAPYKNVIVLGHGLDDKGVKMSKSKGNVVSWDIVEEVGADTVRWYFFSASAPWLPNRFDRNALDEVKRKFLGTLWNTYAFYILYAGIDNFDATKHKLDYETLPELDKWLISRLNTLIKRVDEGLADYKLTETSREIARFVDDLSNWYVRRSRERFWASGMEQDKINAYMTLYTALTTLSKLCAPYIPFMAEQIYQNLVVFGDDCDAPQSVHLCDFPTYDEALILPDLEENMGAVLSIVSAGRAARNTANIKNRQPLAKMYVQPKGGMELTPAYLTIIGEELNVKAVEILEDAGHMVGRKIKPNLKILGPKHGKILPKIGQALAEGDGNKLFADLAGEGISLNIEGEEIHLTMADVLVEEIQTENHASNMADGFLVVLNTELTPELIEEGFVREVISKIQTMRKEADFEVQDKITIAYTGSDKITDIITKNARFINAEVLSASITYGTGDDAGFHKAWDINGEPAEFWVKKI
ncbi:MAG: isoleucine--tRNA ligase [Defluviitaleaceae bacterium]|nr:isoleucine--tRNA ligase [Defluviitaleaceae bacterium]